MDEAAARARLLIMLPTTSAPTLSTGDVDELLALARRSDRAGNRPGNVTAAPTWVSSTTYLVDDTVRQNPAAGRWWRCIIPGTSGPTQPTWPDLSGRLVTGITLFDGDVIWEDNGTEWAPTYDLNLAAAEGWAIKAGRVAHRFDFGTDDQNFRRSQMIDHCRAMEQTYRRKIVGTTRTPAARAR